MSNLKLTQLSFDHLRFSHSQFVELFNSLSSRDKNSLKNSQSGTELNQMCDFLCSVLGKKVVDEKKARKSKPKSVEVQAEGGEVQAEEGEVHNEGGEVQESQHVEQTTQQSQYVEEKKTNKSKKTKSDVEGVQTTEQLQVSQPVQQPVQQSTKKSNKKQNSSVANE